MFLLCLLFAKVLKQYGIRVAAEEVVWVVPETSLSTMGEKNNNVKLT